MGSRPSSGETRLTCVPRTTTRPSFLVLSNTRSESSGSGSGYFELRKKKRVSWHEMVVRFYSMCAQNFTKQQRSRCPTNAASILYVGCCWFHDTPDGDLNAFSWNRVLPPDTFASIVGCLFRSISVAEAENDPTHDGRLAYLKYRTYNSAIHCQLLRWRSFYCIGILATK